MVQNAFEVLLIEHPVDKCQCRGNELGRSSLIAMVELKRYGSTSYDYDAWDQFGRTKEQRWKRDATVRDQKRKRGRESFLNRDFFWSIALAAMSVDWRVPLD